MGDSERERAHLNLIDSSRQFFEFDPEAAIEAEPGWLFGAGSATHPVISNAAFRRDDDVDGDLAAAAEAAGFQAIWETPEMLLDAPLPTEPLPAGTELRRLSESDQVPDFWGVAKAAYATNGFPPEVFAGYTRHETLLTEDVAAFIAYVDGEPGSIAMTIVSHGVAGIYWVGSVEWARGLGLGRAVTVAATNAGFELGAEVASLQASPMGRPIYTKLGYETVFDYKLLISPVS